MGNVLTQSTALRTKGDVTQDDLKWLAVENSAIFHDTYVSEQFDNLPAFEGTELVEKDSKKDDGGTSEGPNVRRFMDLLVGAGQPLPSVAEIFNINDEQDEAIEGFNSIIRMRSRLLQRIHLAILRESERIREEMKSKKKTGSDTGTVLQRSDVQQVDPGSLLTMASMRISLSLLKTLRGTNPLIFKDMCESLMSLFELSSPETLGMVNSNQAQKETFQQITDFAASVAETSTGEERSYALALIFALGVARGSVSDLLRVVTLLTKGQDSLPETGALAPFWRKLLDFKHQYKLILPNVFFPDGEEVSVKAAVVREEGGFEHTKAPIASDGTYVFIFNVQTLELEKVGTGLHGTIAGTVYDRSTDLMKSLRQEPADEDSTDGSLNESKEDEMEETEEEESIKPSGSSEAVGPGRTMIRIQTETEIHVEPFLDADVVRIIGVGETAELIQQLTDGLDLDWVRISEGWICMEPMALVTDDTGTDSEDDDVEEEEEEDDEEEETSMSGSEEELIFEQQSSSPVLEIFVEGEAPKAGSSDDHVEGWLSYLDGKLIFKLKGIMKPLEYAVISATSLKFEGMRTLNLPLLQQQAEDEEAADEVDTSNPLDNFADYEQGARVLELGDDDNTCRNLLCRTDQRIASASGSSRHTLPISVEDSVQSLTLNLGQARTLARVGVEMFGSSSGEDAPLTASLPSIIVLFSPDGSEDGYTEVTTLTASEGGWQTLTFIEVPEDRREGVQNIRFTFLLGPTASVSVQRLLACETIEGGLAKKELIVPIVLSDCRSLLAVHVSQVEPLDESEQKLHVHIMDRISGEIKASYEFQKKMSQSDLHKRGLVSNGESLMLVGMTNSNIKDPHFEGTLLDFDSQEILEEKQFEWQGSGGPRLVPQSFTYDLWNNYIWGYDYANAKLTHWRNTGLPPRFYPAPPDPADLVYSTVPSYRLEGLQQQTVWADKQGATGMQAAKILCHLDRCAERFHVPEKATADDSYNELLVSASGKDEGNMVRFMVRGQNVWSSPGKGFNIVRLDGQYNAVECRNFDTTGTDTFHTELLADYISRVPPGGMVMVATREDAAAAFDPLARKALRTLGADQTVEKLEPPDLFVLIGRKGASPSTVVQKTIKGGLGTAVVRQKVPLIHVPLSLEPTIQTFASLTAFLLANQEALRSDNVPGIMQVNVLCALSIMTTNVYQLLSSSPTITSKTFPPEMAQLKGVLLSCIDSPPQKTEGGRAISDAALKLFVSSIDFFYPTATERCNLLIEYMRQYVAGKLSALEANVLGLLLKRVSSPPSLLSLLDEQGKSAGGSNASIDLFVTIMGIAKGEIIQALDAGQQNSLCSPRTTKQRSSQYAIGQAAVQMLSSLCNQLLSQTAHSIVLASEKAGEDKDSCVADIEVLLRIFKSLSDASTEMLDKAIASCEPITTSNSPKRANKNGPMLSKEVDLILRTSPVGALLPLLVLVTMELVRYQSASLIPTLSELSKLVAPLMERVRKVVELLPKDKRISARGPVESTPKKKVVIMESEHPYRSNMNEVMTLSIPKADRITIEFDPQSATETNYDYIILWKNDARTEKWHEADRLTGRSGSENWPGQGGRPPLVIEGDLAIIEWHSDGSNEDWGWRFTATAEFKKQAVFEELHWLVQLDRQLNACGAALAKGLTVSVEWGGELEDRNVTWMEDEVLSSHYSVKSSKFCLPHDIPKVPSNPHLAGLPKSPRRAAEETEAQFLQMLITRPKDSPTAALVSKMRKLVKEDQPNVNNVDAQNTAVYASIAALIKHNGLAAEAVAIANDARAEVSESLIRVWKSGVKMRQFFLYGDLQQAREATEGGELPNILERGPSIYSGAEDAVIEKTSKEIVEKAQFLLRLEAPRVAKNVARKRWALMAKYGKAREEQGENHGDKWAAVVNELHAAYKIKSMFDYRRRAADKKRKSNRTITERLLRFLQAPVKLEEIEMVKERRNRRADYRAEGIHLLGMLLTQATSPTSQSCLLFSFMQALREARHGRDTSSSHVHYLNGVEGSSIECAARLTESFSSFLRCVVEVLRVNVPYVVSAKNSTKVDPDRKAREQAVMTAFKAISLDYDIKDHDMIEESDLVNVLDVYLSCGNPDVRLTAWKLFETLLPRSVHICDSQIFEDPSNMSKHMLGLVVRQLETIAQLSKERQMAYISSSLSEEEVVLEDGPEHHLLVDGVVQLDRSTVGKVVPHTPLNLNTSLSLWLYRNKGPLDEGWTEGKISEGLRVVRGPHWNSGDQDIRSGNLGTVIKVNSPSSVSVRWDGSDNKYTYRWGAEEEGTKMYDVVVVDEGVGGNVVCKGASDIIEPELRSPWSMFNLAVTDSSTLRFSVSLNEKDCFDVVGHTRIPSEKWVHVAVTTSKDNVALYLNGELDAEKALEPSLLHAGPAKKAMVEVETMHPYEPNMDQYYPVEVPDAESYVITFSDASRTERNYDFVCFYAWDDETKYGEDKYTGGFNSTERTFAGVEGMEPLVINAPRFRVFFHSDGSNQDWGFKLTAVAKLAVRAEDIQDAGIQDLNPCPFYLGQPPSYISQHKGVMGMMAKLTIFRDTLTADQVQEMVSKDDARSFLPTAAFNEDHCVQVLSLLNKNVPAMPLSSIKSLTTPTILDSVLRLSFAPSFSARFAATCLCATLLPYVEPKIVDTQMAKLECGTTGVKSGLIWELLLSIGKVLVSSFDQSRSLKAKDGAESAFALTYQRLILLRALAKSELWASSVKEAILEVLRSTPNVIDTMEGTILAELNNQSAIPASNEQLLLFAVLGLLGGYVGGISVGAVALVELEGKKGAFEECTIVALTYAPVLDEDMDKEKARKHSQQWEDYQGFGDAVVVVLHTEPTKTYTYPRTKLAPLPLRDTMFLNTIMEGSMDVVLAVFKQILRVDVSSRLPCYLPKKCETDKIEVIESDHPYEHNCERKWKLDFPGAKQIEITFDGETRTDYNNDYVRFQKDDKEGAEFWGEDKYHGRDRQQNWPGLQGRPPLIIPASSCVVTFKSDYEENDWGFKLTAKAHVVETTQPPERPPLFNHVAFLQLYMQGIKAISTIIGHVPAVIKPATSMVTQLLVNASLRPPTRSGEYVKKAEALTLESKHPYDCNEDRYENISFPGAKKLTVVFDNKTASERGCDYLRFYKDDSHSEFWGENQYTGGKDGSSSNWPGAGGNPVLEIPADRCVLYWHTDGSVVDWGWLVTITPDFGKGEGMDGMSLTEITARTFYTGEYLYDQPRNQKIPEDLDSFETAPLPEDPLDASGFDLAAANRPDILQRGDSLAQDTGKVIDKRFVLNYHDAETVVIRAEPSSDSNQVALLMPDEHVTVVGEDKDWLQIHRDGVEGWVLRRENDLVYMVPVDDNTGDLVTIPNDDLQDAQIESSTNPMYECMDTVIATAEAPPVVAGISPIDSLVGQSERIWNAMTECIEYTAIGHARQSVSALIVNWPEDEPFRMESFGGATQFIKFLQVCFEEEKGNDVNNSRRLNMLKQKILQVLRGSGEEPHILAKALIRFSVRQLREAVELQSNIKPTKGKMQCVETLHNYLDNTDQYWPVSFPGAKRIKLVFDPRCSTEQNCDYVVIYKDSTHSSEARWTPVNYTGRSYDNPNKNWPGVDGRPPLYIEADNCEIHFHSDGSNVDWGVRIMCYGIMKEPTLEEVQEFKEKRAQFTGCIELACWLLEIIAAEPLEPVQERLYCKSTLRTLRTYLDCASPNGKIWMVHLVSSILNNVGTIRLPPEAVSEVKRLIEGVKELTIAQYAQEEAAADDRKSPLLQALIQATVLGQASSLMSDTEPALLSHQQENNGDGSFAETEMESKFDELKSVDGRPIAIWSAQRLISGVSLDSTSKIVSSRDLSQLHTVLAATPIHGSSYTWRLCIQEFSALESIPIIGAADVNMPRHASLGAAGISFGWDGRQVFFPGQDPVAFGSGLDAGDIVTVVMDMVKGLLFLYRNKAKIGLAVGPMGSGAAVETSALFNRSMYPAVTLRGQSCSVRLMAPELTSLEEALLRSSGVRAESSAAFLDKIRDAVDYMRAFSQRTIPSVVIRKEFLSQAREKNKVEIESPHPYDSSCANHTVTIPGAQGLEVRFHWKTCMGKEDVVRVIGCDDQEFSFKGMEHGMDANNAGSSISVGDLVVRGPSWDWGDQDGGTGCIGEVKELKSWKGKTEAGVLVHWLKSDFTALYRWGFEGKYDLTVYGPGNNNTRPILIAGSTVKLEVQGHVQSPIAATSVQDLDASTGSVGGGWSGAMRFEGGESSLSIFPAGELELSDDFTLEAWVRTNTITGKRVIFSRTVEMMDMMVEDLPVHQLVLRMVESQLVFSITNGEQTMGVKITGGRLMVGRWHHVAVTVQDRTCRLYLDGSEVGNGAFHGSRLPSLGANLLVGNMGNQWSWLGHIYDARVWDRALGPSRIAVNARPGSGLDNSQGLVTRMLDFRPNNPDILPNLLAPDAIGMVKRATWDEVVEPVFVKANSSQPWGFKITILPIYATSALDKIPSIADEFSAFREPYIKGDIRHDLAIVRYLNNVAINKGFTVDQLLACRWEDIAPSESDTVRLPLIKELMMVPVSDLSSDKKRTAASVHHTMIQLLNTYLKDVLALIDLGMIDKPWSMASLVSQSRGLIYTMLKDPSWNNALQATGGNGSTFELRLSRSRALKFATSGQVDDEGRSMVFSQAFRQIHVMPPRSLRRSDKLYTVFWMGERAQDAGGPYRETWSVYCNELQSTSLPLLRRTQNGIHSTGQNREQWVLNPGATSATHLEMFAFLGKLMGIVIRNKEYLNLDLSSVVWKLIAQEPLTLEDLEAIDVELVKTLKQIRNADEEGFDLIFDSLDFTTLSADERVIELVPGGRDQQLNYINRLDYLNLVEQYRLHEFDIQAAAIRAGLASIVPAKLLALFTWEELEQQVCGQKHVDVSLLQSVTEYSGCRADDPHVRFFWQVLEGYTDEERSMFLRFCWGRSRLPLRADAFPQRFKLQNFQRSNPDSYLPVSHTCFFSLELPAYSSVEVMEQKLTYAIWNCQAIDGDDTELGQAAAQMGWED